MNHIEPYSFGDPPFLRNPYMQVASKPLHAADFSSLQPGIQSIGNKTNHKLDVVLLSPAWGHWKVGKQIGQMQNKGISHDFTIFHLQPLMSPSSMVWTSFMGWFQRNMQETINICGCKCWALCATMRKVIITSHLTTVIPKNHQQGTHLRVSQPYPDFILLKHSHSAHAHSVPVEGLRPYRDFVL